MEYEVSVKTADKRGAGTGMFIRLFRSQVSFTQCFIDANVFLSIFGDKSKIEQSQLKQSIDKSKNLFEAAATNRFQVRGPDVGKVRQE